MGQDSKVPTTTAIMVAGSYNSKCKKNLESCPPGHEMRECTEGRYCEQCEDIAYQPNSNKFGDKCRLRRMCTQRFMKYQHHGSTVKDANCMCFEGYHFENEDQRACVPNRECDKGYGQGPYGVCENCLSKNMYSNVKDRLQACKPLKNCEKASRCTLKKSNGTFDNVCGPVMDDIVNCDNLTTEKPKVEESSNTVIIIGCVSVLLFIGVIIVLCYYFCFHRPRSRSHKKKDPTPEEIHAVASQVIQNAEKDETYCKRALNISCTIIEDNIDRQIWSLPQELFRKHFQAGKYEVIVEKYKGNQPKVAVSGYFKEWRSWKEDKAETITDLFTCLKKCNRNDIVYMIAKRLNEIDSDVPEKLSDKDDSLQKQKPSYMVSLLYSLLPCFSKKRRYPSEEKASEKPETMNRLLDTESGAELQQQTHPPPLAAAAATARDEGADAQQAINTVVTIPSHAPANCKPYRGSLPSAPMLDVFELQQQQQQQQQQTLHHHPHLSFSQPPQQSLQQQQQQQNQLHRQHLPAHPHHHA